MQILFDLDKDIKFITQEEYENLKKELESTSYMLNTYMYALQKDLATQ